MNTVTIKQKIARSCGRQTRVYFEKIAIANQLIRDGHEPDNDTAFLRMIEARYRSAHKASAT